MFLTNGKKMGWKEKMDESKKTRWTTEVRHEASHDHLCDALRGTVLCNGVNSSVIAWVGV